MQPIPVLVRCRDLSYVDGDGTFVNEIEARTLGVGIPLARVVFRVRPAEVAAPAGAASETAGVGAGDARR